MTAFDIAVIFSQVRKILRTKRRWLSSVQRGKPIRYKMVEFVSNTRTFFRLKDYFPKVQI